MKDKLITQINKKAINLSENNYKILEKDDNSCLIKTIENGKTKFYQYLNIGDNNVQLSIYDSIKDNQELRRAAEFICNFNNDEILTHINKKVYTSNGSLLEEVNLKY